MENVTGNRRRQLLARRRTIRAMRRLKIEPLGENRVRFTCATCGHAEEGPPNKVGTMSAAAIERMVRYWNANGGMRGECKRCTKEARDKSHPLRR
jgi:hypothetical protein